MNYRAEIDGVRAIAVVSVILFHLGFEFIAGGYVGVDIFFVISGYLITGLIYSEIKSKNFSYIKFYKRRVARLLPALVITLLMVLIFGFFFYDNQAFDNLGKEVLFSSLGVANILFGQGINYFAQDEAVRPLIHLWSLGVEEQFYFIWPTLLILFLSLKFVRSIPAFVWSLILLSFSLSLAIYYVDSEPTKAYFYPQYRAFELLIGSATALFMKSSLFDELNISDKVKDYISIIAVLLMVIPMFIFDKDTPFPSFYTLAPTLGTALFIAFANQTSTAKLFSTKYIVFIGLISYPLYLYHQPVISYLHFFKMADSTLLSLAVVMLFSIPLASFTYLYIEKPIRRVVHKPVSSKIYILSLIGMLGLLGASGLFVAKNNGLGERFKILNPFAYSVSQNSATTFHKNFSRGFSVSKKSSGKILFIGDSVVQHYVYPISKSLGIPFDEVDTITRGGCVLLKDVEFQDPYQLSDISCSSLRKKLYSIKKKYEYIVISQSWSTYDENILNSNSQDTIKKWESFIDETLKFIEPLAQKVIIIGLHPEVSGTLSLKPTIFLTQAEYLSKLEGLKITNIKEINKNRGFFNKWKSSKVEILEPLNLFYQGEKARLHNGKFSFFSDKHHLAKSSTDYVVDELKKQNIKK